jgi:DNA repair exonuclease SbcCD ATPase subunit
MGNGVPSVAIVANLPSSTSVMAETNSEELNQKNAEIASLSLKLNDRSKQISDLEKRMHELEADRKSGDPNIQKDLTLAISERNDLRERLKEYEIIEEDLANLKRFRQENDQLKSELAALKNGAPQVKTAPPPPPAPVPVPIPVAPPVIEEEEMDLEAEMARAIAESMAPKPAAAAAEAAMDFTEPDISEIPTLPDEQKTAEELLSEFEKMLG